MENLHKLQKENLIFTDESCKDRINTTLTLKDYDWMHYELDTAFFTEDIGRLSIRFEYIGSTLSYMYVKQYTNYPEEYNSYVYSFDSDIFKKYIQNFLLDFSYAFDKPYVFNGGDVVLDFYNEILEKGELIKNKDIKEIFDWD